MRIPSNKLDEEGLKKLASELIALSDFELVCTITHNVNVRGVGNFTSYNIINCFHYGVREQVRKAILNLPKAPWKELSKDCCEDCKKALDSSSIPL